MVLHKLYIDPDLEVVVLDRSHSLDMSCIICIQWCYLPLFQYCMFCTMTAILEQSFFMKITLVIFEASKIHKWYRYLTMELLVQGCWYYEPPYLVVVLHLLYNDFDLGVVVLYRDHSHDIWCILFNSISSIDISSTPNSKWYVPAYLVVVLHQLYNDPDFGW